MNFEVVLCLYCILQDILLLCYKISLAELPDVLLEILRPNSYFNLVGRSAGSFRPESFRPVFYGWVVSPLLGGSFRP